jgi:hypothetical protein
MNKNQPTKPGGFNVLHPNSIPTALRGSATQQARTAAADRARTRRVLRAGATQSDAIAAKFGSAALPTVAEYEASRDKQNARATQPPSLAEYQAKRYGTKGK